MEHLSIISIDPALLFTPKSPVCSPFTLRMHVCSFNHSTHVTDRYASATWCFIQKWIIAPNLEPVDGRTDLMHSTADLDLFSLTHHVSFSVIWELGHDLIWEWQDSGFSECWGLVFPSGRQRCIGETLQTLNHTFIHSFQSIDFVFNVHLLYRVVIPLEACFSGLFYLETKYLNYWTPLKTTETSETSMMLEILVKLCENVKDVPEAAALNLNSKGPNAMCLETKRNQSPLQCD